MNSQTEYVRMCGIPKQLLYASEDNHKSRVKVYNVLIIQTYRLTCSLSDTSGR